MRNRETCIIFWVPKIIRSTRTKTQISRIFSIPPSKSKHRSKMNKKALSISSLGTEVVRRKTSSRGHSRNSLKKSQAARKKKRKKAKMFILFIIILQCPAIHRKTKKTAHYSLNKPLNPIITTKKAANHSTKTVFPQI